MPTDQTIPESIRAFLRETFSTSAQLEALLIVLAATNDEKARIGWTAQEITAELRSEPNLIATALRALQESGVLEVTEASSPAALRYRFSPRTPEMRQNIESIARLYRERRHSVLGIIYDPAPRSSVDAAKAFSDAFRLRAPHEDKEA